MTLQIFAIDRDGERYEIDDLYFFEGEGVHWFTDKGYEGYTFEIFYNDKEVYNSRGYGIWFNIPAYEEDDESSEGWYSNKVYHSFYEARDAIDAMTNPLKYERYEVKKR